MALRGSSGLNQLKYSAQTPRSYGIGMRCRYPRYHPEGASDIGPHQGRCAPRLQWPHDLQLQYSCVYVSACMHGCLVSVFVRAWPCVRGRAWPCVRACVAVRACVCV